MTKAVVRCNGSQYESWKGVNIKRSIDQISAGFHLDFKDSWTGEGKRFGLNPQDEVSISIAGQKIITGYIDSLDGGLKDASVYSVEGRDKSGDLVDCSCPTSPAQYKGLSLLQIANTLGGKVGVSFRLGINLPASVSEIFPVFTPNPGEMLFECIERAARLRGVLLVPDGTGDVVISTKGSYLNPTPLVEGDNIKAISYKIDYSKRFSDYTVRGQHHDAEGFNGTSTSVIGRAKDAGLRRYRPLVIHGETKITQSLATARAQWEASVRAARSLVLTVTLYEWIDRAGRPWELNQLVSLRTPRMEISGTYLISGTEFSLVEGEGSTTTLTLMRPDAFLSEPVVPKKQADQAAKGFHSK